MEAIHPAANFSLPNPERGACLIVSASVKRQQSDKLFQSCQLRSRVCAVDFCSVEVRALSGDSTIAGRTWARIAAPCFGCNAVQTCRQASAV